MSRITRREFIIRGFEGVTCALIAPDFYRQAVDHLHDKNVPLIVTPRDPKTVLYAVWYGDDYQLNVGPPDEDIPTITWREFLEDYAGVDPDELGDEDLEDTYGIDRDDLDRDCSASWYEDAWCRTRSSNAQAYHYLSGLDLGPLSSHGGFDAGELQFIDGCCPGNDYLGVHIDGKISLSFLQERLNQLGENVEIKIT